MFGRLQAEAAQLGKPEWRPVLLYLAQLHARGTKPAGGPFARPWEEIGPGYCGRPAFGHWDIVHQILDVLPREPEHARNQILNNLQNQEPDGLIPGVIWLRKPAGEWSREVGHPPVWPVAVADFVKQYQDRDLLATCYAALRRQIGWFESTRRAEGEGFFYTDILNHSWESGVDDGVRFDRISPGRFACIDATAHVFWLYRFAAAWAEELGEAAPRFQAAAAELQTFLQRRCFDEETGFFHDIWAVGHPEQRHLAYEGMWPMVVGAATAAQAARVIDENLLAASRFFAKHPITTVAKSDPLFELRMWRGPAWNSMTYWAARGCVQAGRRDAARQLLEAALDGSAEQYAATGTIWEFYHPDGGAPHGLQRKPYTDRNLPCEDYLGHNPLFAMTRMWEEVEPVT